MEQVPPNSCQMADGSETFAVQSLLSAVQRPGLTGGQLPAGEVFQVDTGNLFSAFQDSSGLLWQADFNFLGKMLHCMHVRAA